jgi:hypothetical protein
MDEIPLNHMMVDIETLSTAPDATVIAIGIALFNPEEGAIGLRHSYLPPIEGQGGSASTDTINWWMRTNAPLFTKYMQRDFDVGLVMDWETISSNLGDLMYGYRVDTIWCNGLDFDLPILAAAFKRTNTENPFDAFSYKQRRDVRQWKLAAELAGWQKPERPAKLTAHNALADAVWQCQEVCSIWSSLRK